MTDQISVAKIEGEKVDFGFRSILERFKQKNYNKNKYVYVV